MAAVNKVILVGNLGADPETRYMQNGDAVTNIRLATTDRWKDKASGEMKEATEWHRVVLFGKLAEIASQYLKKGSSVYFEGQIKTRKWQDKDGNDKYTTEIHCKEMQMLGNKSGGGDDGGGYGGGRDSNNGGQQRQQRQQQPSQQQGGGGGQQQRGGGGGFNDMDDDIPFAGIDARLPI